jgi:hypothetical protein
MTQNRLAMKKADKRTQALGNDGQKPSWPVGGALLTWWALNA